MNKIKTTYSDYTIDIYNIKYKLSYKERTYQKKDIEHLNIIETKKYIQELKKEGFKIKWIGDKFKKDLYIIIKNEFYSFNEKLQVLNELFKIINPNNNMSLLEDINYQWVTKNFQKTTKDILMDKPAIILDVFTSYLLVEGMKNNFILTRYDQKKIDKLEVVSCYNNAKGFVVLNSEDRNRQKMKQLKNKYEKQIRKWKYTKTYKFNNLYILEAKTSGIIDTSFPYSFDWCHIDTENVFIYEDVKYQIDFSLSQYKCDSDNQCIQDKILILSQNDKLYFYDMDINQIDNDLIKKY